MRLNWVNWESVTGGSGRERLVELVLVGLVLKPAPACRSCTQSSAWMFREGAGLVGELHPLISRHKEDDLSKAKSGRGLRVGCPLKDRLTVQIPMHPVRRVLWQDAEP